MDIIKKYYDENMKTVKKVTVDSFSSCGALKEPIFLSGVSVVFFYVPECRFCQLFSSELQRFDDLYSKELSVKVSAIDMSTDENKRLIKLSESFPYQLGVAWPVIMIYYDGKPCSYYNSVRTAEGLRDYIRKYIGVGKECKFKFVPCD